MARKPTWSKEQCKTAVETIAQAIAKAFNIPAPAVVNMLDLHPTWGNWEFQTEESLIWTKSGAAKVKIDIDAKFAHMYFCFDDPKRALAE